MDLPSLVDDISSLPSSLDPLNCSSASRLSSFFSSRASLLLSVPSLPPLSPLSYSALSSLNGVVSHVASHPSVRHYSPSDSSITPSALSELCSSLIFVAELHGSCRDAGATHIEKLSAACYEDIHNLVREWVGNPRPPAAHQLEAGVKLLKSLPAAVPFLLTTTLHLTDKLLSPAAVLSASPESSSCLRALFRGLTLPSDERNSIACDRLAPRLVCTYFCLLGHVLVGDLASSAADDCGTAKDDAARELTDMSGMLLERSFNPAPIRFALNEIQKESTMLRPYAARVLARGE